MSTVSTTGMRQRHGANSLLAVLALCGLVLLAAASPLAAAPAVGAPRQMLELAAVTDSDVTVSAEGGGVIITPGMHSITGNMTIGGSGSRVIVQFGEENTCGQLKVAGNLVLGPETRPVLSLDLGTARFVTGETFVIFSASEIVGEFAGLRNGSSLRIGDTSLRIDYSDNSIILTVTETPNRRQHWVTPVVEFDAGLIIPTSTAPI